jgi:hypothetical protein
MAITKKICIILLNLLLIIFGSPVASSTALIMGNSCAVPFPKDIFYGPEANLSKIFNRLLKPLPVGSSILIRKGAIQIIFERNNLSILLKAGSVFFLRFQSVTCFDKFDDPFDKNFLMGEFGLLLLMVKKGPLRGEGVFRRVISQAIKN